MEYLLVKNISLRDLLAPSGGAIPWVSYGFNVMAVKGYVGQGWDSSNEALRNHITVIPISNQNLFDSKLASLQNRIDTNLFENDSIEVITDSEANSLKDTIDQVRAGTI